MRKKLIDRSREWLADNFSGDQFMTRFLGVAYEKSPCFFQYLVLLYFLTGLAETILVYTFSFGTADTSALIKALSVNIFISLGLLILYSRFQNFGAALLVTMGLIIVAGLLKSPVLLVAMICVFIILFFVNIKALTKSTVLPSISLRIKVAVGLLIFALLFGLIAIGGTRYIGFNAGKLIIAGSANLDSLFHISVAAMIRDYGIISTGLHGTPPFYYHAFSHFIFGCISSITGLSLLKVYGNVQAVVIVPLLFLAILACAEDFASSINRSELFIRIGVVWLALFGFGGFEHNAIFYRYGLMDDHLVSESYTMGLIFLLAMISSLRIPSSRIRWPFVFLLLVCMSLAKSSVGLLGGIFLFVHLAFFERERFLYRLLFFSFTACILFVLLSIHYFQQNANLGDGGYILSQGGNQWFSFARTYGGVSGAWPEPQFCISLTRFIVFHFIYPWLFLGLAVVSGWFCKKKSFVGNLCITLNIIALLYGLIALWKLHLYGGSESYFSNISMFVALPFLALILGQNSSIAFQKGFIKAAL